MRFWLILVAVFALIVTPFISLRWDSPTAVAAAGMPRQPQSLEILQEYLDPAPRGMDVRYCWTLPGGRGENVRIVDIEIDWNLNHNDLVEATSNAFLLMRGVDPQPEIHVDHGTAVLGELVAAPDGIGVTGIAHGASIGLINPAFDGTALRVAEAVRQATRRLDAGDVILIEQQSLAGPRLDINTGRGLVSIEFEPEVFDAIKEATSRGIVVIEPAANGSDDLDHPAYGGRFDINSRDSGAIIVGSGMPPDDIFGPGPDRARTDESNYGSRVDVQGWGRAIATCGFGDLLSCQGKNNLYTFQFGATSGAAAMIAGAAALIQSIMKERGLAPLTPAQLRRLLIATGSPQQGDLSESIGPRPNLRAAVETLISDQADLVPVITKIKHKKAKGRLIVDGVNFIAGDSVVEVNGAAVPRVKYPSDYVLPGGVAFRINTKGNISSMLPRGQEVAITVFTPSTGKRSEPFLLLIK